MSGGHPKTAVHWFRKGLRVHDNPALKLACDRARNDPHTSLRPIFILDPGLLQWLRVGPNRWRFLQQTLVQLDASLRTIRSRLYVVRGNPKSVLPRLFAAWNVTLLTFEADIEPYARQRDALAEVQAREHGVRIEQVVSHTIYDPDLVIQRNLGTAPAQYQRYLTLVEGLKVPEPIDEPEPLPARTVPPPDEHERKNASCYACPSLAELGVSDASALGECLYPGGEQEALRRMRLFLDDPLWICAFEKPNTSPNSLQPSTTVLSPYLKFGCLSARLLYRELRTVVAKHPRAHTKPPVSLIGQLLWREFYYTAAASEPHFDRMHGNRFCRQIPWKYDAGLLEAWTHGRTGYPFIDACMRQLRQEGWIHHLARHAVACFLTRGDLWQSWEDGQRVFEELLLDADWALNAGNWMWLSASGFFYQYFRVYSPVAFGKKTDKEGEYIRRYVPELAAFPARVIYEPWKATMAEQRSWKCVLGKDYPHRVVVHETVSKVNLARMAAAYKKHNAGGGTASDQDEDDKKAKEKKKPVLLVVKKEKKDSPPSPSYAAVPSTSSSSTSHGLPAKRARTTQRDLKAFFKTEPKSPTK